MLIMFRAKNFMSFKDDVILDMRATTLREHPSHITQKDKYALLKTLAIYGANASGKSCLISALFCYEQFIKNNLFTNDLPNYLDENNNTVKGFCLKVEPFSLSAESSKEIEMEMIFYANGSTYQFGFSFAKNIIHNEWFIVNDETVYERKDMIVKAGQVFKTQLKDYTKLRDDRLFLAVLDYFSIGPVKDMVDHFKEYFRSQFHVFFELFLETSVKGTGLSFGLSNMLIENDALRNKVAHYIRAIDSGINDLVVHTISIKDQKTGEVKIEKIIKTSHSVYNNQGEKTGDALFDFNRESTGTLRFISYIQQAATMLENGGVFIIDELTARFHPLLTRFFVNLFQTEENQNVQLIFTTHDASLMNHGQFRRDEIAFVDKNEKGESQLFTLADLKIRSDASYGKDYFNGKYGAIPIIHEILHEDGEIVG